MEKENKKNNGLGITETIDIGLIDPGEINFYKTAGGFTGLVFKGSDLGRITLRRALPVRQPLEYIFISDKDNNEIGMIRHIKDLETTQQELAMDELDKRYYCPCVSCVVSAEDKLGYVYFEFRLKTNNGESVRGCAVKDVSKNIRIMDTDSVLIFDTDGNRYKIESLSRLDKKSLKKMQPYLF